MRSSHYLPSLRTYRTRIESHDKLVSGCIFMVDKKCHLRNGMLTIFGFRISIEEGMEV